MGKEKLHVPACLGLLAENPGLASSHPYGLKPTDSYGLLRNGPDHNILVLVCAYTMRCEGTSELYFQEENVQTAKVTTSGTFSLNDPYFKYAGIVQGFPVCWG